MRTTTQDTRKLVLIETPYRTGDRLRNLRYLAWCEYHSANLGEDPIASHGNCTAYYPENDESRKLGFEWRDRMAARADLIVYYTDLGDSEGAMRAFTLDVSMKRVVVERTLPESLMARFEAGELPPGSMARVPSDLLRSSRRSRSPRIYVAGPFRSTSAWQIERNIYRAERLGLVITRMGGIPVIPHSMYRYYHGELSVDQLVAMGLSLMETCAAVAVDVSHAEAQNSDGTVGEIKEAIRNGQPVFYDEMCLADRGEAGQIADDSGNLVLTVGPSGPEGKSGLQHWITTGWAPRDLSFSL